MIRAGTAEEAFKCSGQWIFVDVGFSERSKSCGLLQDDMQPEALTFSELRTRLRQIAGTPGTPLNLVLEAPLSVAFNSAGNPTGRSVERRDQQRRYWYVGLGCSVLVAALHLLRAIHDTPPAREIRLFEGLVSFKAKGIASNHIEDVKLLQKVVWEPSCRVGSIISAQDLAASPTDHLESAFSVAGMNFGVPAVVAVGVQLALKKLNPVCPE